MGPRNSRRRWSYWILGRLGATLILLLSTLGVHGGDPRAVWLSTAFQVINLEPIPMPIEARFLALDGTAAYTLADTLPPGQARFYEPSTMDPPLPATFSGTLAVDAPGQVALEVLHLSETITGGNTILEAAADELLGHSGYVPINRYVQPLLRT